MNKWRAFSTRNLACRKYKLNEPQLLTSDQKLSRLIMSEAMLAMFEADPDGSVKHFLTQDKCWVHHFKPETEQKSSSPARKKAKGEPSARKVMASNF